MDEVKFNILYPLIVGLVTLFIEYGIIKPSQEKEKIDTESKMSNISKVSSRNSSNETNYLWSNFLFSKIVLSETILIYLKVIFYVLGSFLILASGGFVIYFFGSLFDGTIETANQYVNVNSTITIPSMLIIGIVLIWAAICLSHISEVNYSSFVSASRMLLWGTVIFDIFLVFNFSNQEGGWIAILNALFGVFFCIYLDTAIRIDKEKHSIERRV